MCVEIRLLFNTFCEKSMLLLFVFISNSHGLMSPAPDGFLLLCTSSGLAGQYIQCNTLVNLGVFAWQMHKHTHNVQQLKLTCLWLQCDWTSMQTSHRCKVLIILLLISGYLNKPKNGLKTAESLRFTDRLITKEQLLANRRENSKTQFYYHCEFTGYNCKQ